MTAIFLIFFSILFYQLLIKPVLNSTTIPNSNYSQTAQNENFMRIWQNLQQFQEEKKAEKQKTKIRNAPEEDRSNNHSKGFQGGEYLDYEEM